MDAFIFSDKKETWKPMEDINIRLKRQGKQRNNATGNAKSDSKNWREDAAANKGILSSKTLVICLLEPQFR